MFRVCAVVAAAATMLFSSLALAVNVNTADAQALAKELSGVGPKTADAIVAERKAHGPYKDAQDLDKRVKGLGPKTLDKNAGKIQF